MVRELKQLLFTNFVSVSVVHRPRECNKVAHALAALGRECEAEFDPILDELPQCIQKLVAEDISAHE